MGKLNNELCHFLNKPAVFAELFNIGIYGGKKVISRENLADVQRTYGETLADRYGRKRRKIRERDVVKALYRNGGYVRLAVENQANLNYCMSFRCLEYDVEDFARQLRWLRRYYQREGGLSGAEYLSGLKRSDKLIPNITIVLYHGAGRWNAPRQLQDMLDMAALDDELKAMHMDYKLHVINLTELDENLFQTGLRELIGVMKCAGDKDKMQRFIEENKERFRNMDDELYDLICTMAGLKELLVKKGKYENKDREESVDMCKAWEDMKAESRAEGKREGNREGEARLGTLISRLYKEGRGAEVLKAAESPRFRNRLYREYGI